MEISVFVFIFFECIGVYFCFWFLSGRDGRKLFGYIGYGAVVGFGGGLLVMIITSRIDLGMPVIVFLSLVYSLFMYRSPLFNTIISERK